MVSLHLLDVWGEGLDLCLPRDVTPRCHKEMSPGNIGNSMGIASDQVKDIEGRPWKHGGKNKPEKTIVYVCLRLRRFRPVWDTWGNHRTLPFCATDFGQGPSQTGPLAFEDHKHVDLAHRCCCRLKTSSLDSWWLMDHVDFFWTNPIKNLNLTNGVWLDQVLGQARTHVAGSAIWRRFGCWSSLPIETPATRFQQWCDIDINIHIMDDSMEGKTLQNPWASQGPVILVWDLLQAIHT